MLPSIPGISDSSYSTPPRLADREPQQLHDEVKLALESALPGVDANTLIHSLDSLLRGRGNYAIVGSTSLHLQAIEHPNRACALPEPNDIDVVVSEISVMRLDDFTRSELGKLGLRQDENLRHVFYMAREGQADLKIDVVSANKREFKKYALNPVSIHGLNVARVHDTLDDYRSRATDREFIQQCGGVDQAKHKLDLWMNYFDQTNADKSMASEKPEQRLWRNLDTRANFMEHDALEDKPARRKLNFS